MSVTYYPKTIEELHREGWRTYPIREWGGFVYVILSELSLRTGLQMIPVLQITDAGWRFEDVDGVREERYLSGVWAYLGEGSHAYVLAPDRKEYRYLIEDLPVEVVPVSRRRIGLDEDGEYVDIPASPA